MSARTLLVVLVVAATAAFVVGVAVERNGGEAHAGPAASSEAGEGHAQSGEEAEHASRGTTEPSREGELRPLGVDIEAAPFVALAAAASLGIALAAWLRPASAPMLAFVAIAMLAFAALDGREVTHQIDESRAGLALLAGVAAVAHAAAAAVAAAMARRATMPA